VRLEKRVERPFWKASSYTAGQEIAGLWHEDRNAYSLQVRATFAVLPLLTF